MRVWAPGEDFCWFPFYKCHELLGICRETFGAGNGKDPRQRSADFHIFFACFVLGLCTTFVNETWLLRGQVFVCFLVLFCRIVIFSICTAQLIFARRKSKYFSLTLLRSVSYLLLKIGDQRPH